ncbi:MAG: ATP-binding protein [Cellvibrionales bacterium]|nr:ATP-binding protein [Cellvibrionales bacterium]
MLLRYGGCNFSCFKEDFDVNLNLNKNCPENISKGLDYSSVMCIKGANGAGKTNALKPFAFLCSFASHSFSLKPDDLIPVESFFNNNNPIDLFAEFRIKNEDYRYEISLTPKKVISETLIKIEQETVLFLRKGNTLIQTDEAFEMLQTIHVLRPNASIFSTAHQYQLPCIDQFYDLFSSVIFNVGFYGFDDFKLDDIDKFYYENSPALAFTKSILKNFDTGISDIVIQKYRDNEDGMVYYPVFHFDTEDGVKKLRLHHQSSGTRRLYHLLSQMFIIFSMAEETEGFSRIWIADELDLHLHSKITPEIIEFFENSEANIQLLFSCQNDKIIDRMGKYRTTLVNKEGNESYTYRLDELRSDLLRNNRTISRHYEAGSIGGVPNFEQRS